MSWQGVRKRGLPNHHSDGGYYPLAKRPHLESQNVRIVSYSGPPITYGDVDPFHEALTVHVPAPSMVPGPPVPPARRIRRKFNPTQGRKAGNDVHKQQIKAGNDVHKQQKSPKVRNKRKAQDVALPITKVPRNHGESSTAATTWKTGLGHSSKDHRRIAQPDSTQPMETSNMCFKDPEYLHELAKKPAPKQLGEICKLKEGFTQFLQSTEECSDRLKVSLMVKILTSLGSYKEKETICQQINKRILQELTSTESRVLLHGLNVILCQMPMESSPSARHSFVNFLGDLNIFFKNLMERYQAFSSQHLPIDVFYGTTKQLASQEIRFQEFEEKAQKLVVERDRIRSTCYQTSADKQQTEQDNTALPTPDELRMKTLPFDLDCNKVTGQYTSTAEYLTLQFRLLREDFIHPLRCALHKLQEVNEDEDCHEVKVYENVRFDSGITCLPGVGTAFKVSFKIPGQEKVKWDRSKRLTYGSLLCLSDDNFNTVIFATVAERNAEELKDGIATIKLEGCDHYPLATSRERVYKMADSPGYYGAYAPVLRRLKQIINEPSKLPFSKYFVECSSNVDLPLYMRNDNTATVLDLSGVVCECKPQELVPAPRHHGILQRLRLLHQNPECNHKNVNISDAVAWTALPTPLLDSSQKKALHTALTNELALIQGPPGTGKTYIGLKIVESLLKRRRQISSPIVVVCYTNHALDQFLEGLIDMKKKEDFSEIAIRRVGGRCKSEKVEQYNIRTYVQQACRQLGIYGCSPHKVYKLQQKIEAMKELLDGRFVPRNCELYCSLFERDTAILLESLCSVTLLHDLQSSPTRLASWLSPVFEGKITEHQLQQEDRMYYPHKAIEDDRKITTEEEEEERFLFHILEREDVEDFVERLGRAEPLTATRAQQLCKDNSIMHIADFVRLQLFKHCLIQLKTGLEADLKQKQTKQGDYEKERELVMMTCLQRADVIGLTTTGAAKHNNILSEIEAKIVIIEEAAEVLEAHVITTLTSHTQHLILIGDHKQLRPKTNDYILARDYHLDVSLFERLVRNNFPCVTLEVQHRMRPEISAIVSSKIYKGTLIDDPVTRRYENIRGMEHNIFFINHMEPETPDMDLKSPANDHEANFLACLCKYLLQQGYKPEEITVITPYTGQMFNLRRAFRDEGGLAFGDRGLPDISGVRITPIDSYQGEENEIILLSLVRSNAANKPGFVKDHNRICVALSRAKQGLYCIGNFSLFRKSSPLWKSIIRDLDSQKLIGKCLPLKCTRHANITKVSCAADFNKVRDGGCDKKCRFRLFCNHVCSMDCHPDEKRHDLPCQEPCPKRCPSQHRCQLLCYEKCGNCEVLVEKEIPKCVHKQQVPCYLDPAKFICQEDCPLWLSCEHPCKNRCGKRCTRECQAFISRVWPCGHEAQAECYKTEEMYAKTCKFPCKEILKCGHPCTGTCGRCRQGRLHKRCRQKCGRPLICGHTCSETCAQNCPPCLKKCNFSCSHGPCGHKCSTPCQACPHRCEWRCKHHKCTRNCGEICDRPRCNKPCTIPLPCGHLCIGLCGEPCPSVKGKPVCRVCNKKKWEELVPTIFGTEEEPDARFVQLVDCGHIFEVQGLDRWIDMDQEEEKQVQIKWKVCPCCNAPIFNTLRYGNIRKQIAKLMNEVKKKATYTLSHDERTRIEEEVKNMAHISSHFGAQKLDHYLRKINTKLPDTQLLQEHLILSAESDAQQHFKKLLQLSLYDPQWSSGRCDGLKRKCGLLSAQTKDFIERLSYKQLLTDQMQIDIHAEQRRIQLLTNLYTLQSDILTKNVTLNETDQLFMDEAANQCESNGQKIDKLTDETKYQSLLSEVKAIPKRYPQLQELSVEERKMIIKALDAKKGSWYRCPKGHVYNIGECGGAMVEGTCPECKARIGGQHHRLLSDNAHAREFDNSSNAAWSDMANMDNFDLQELL